MREMNEGAVFRCDDCGVEVTVTRGGECTCLVCCGTEMAERPRADREEPGTRSGDSPSEDDSSGC